MKMHEGSLNIRLEVLKIELALDVRGQMVASRALMPRHCRSNSRDQDQTSPSLLSVMQVSAATALADRHVHITVSVCVDRVWCRPASSC